MLCRIIVCYSVRCSSVVPITVVTVVISARVTVSVVAVVVGMSISISVVEVAVSIRIVGLVITVIVMWSVGTVVVSCSIVVIHDGCILNLFAIMRTEFAVVTFTACMSAFFTMDANRFFTNEC